MAGVLFIAQHKTVDLSVAVYIAIIMQQQIFRVKIRILGGDNEPYGRAILHLLGYMYS